MPERSEEAKPKREPNPYAKLASRGPAPDSAPRRHGSLLRPREAPARAGLRLVDHSRLDHFRAVVRVGELVRQVAHPLTERSPAAEERRSRGRDLRFAGRLGSIRCNFRCRTPQGQ